MGSGIPDSLAPPPGRGRPARVLIVDDEPDILDSLARVLPQLDSQFDPVLASSAEEALAILAHDEDFVAILCDHKMPGLLGVDLLVMLRWRCPSMVRILMTAFPDPVLYHRASREAGVRCVLAKPFDVQGLASTLRKLAGPPA